ncbi:siderophore-interacting protein [Ruegeria sp. Ofav3-42]|uniref:siderophore-interacting protein n=1 Tax=Ruegeria sp. Ofav3-42 TaxID=2917759 RepID=UPI001EF5AFEA|nr:siderophore-interacting protein [Ruegeria sp. Ofav3-42]MCG7521789.1 siderophore-interacting protein [Ruegeria sp. Ofav3-42]
MLNRPDYLLNTQTFVPGLEFAAVRDLMLGDAERWDLPVKQDDAQALVVQLAYGVCSFEQQPSGTLAGLHATRPEKLHVIRERLLARLTELIPEQVGGLRWSGVDQSELVNAGGHPPNFHFATVLDVSSPAASFLRVRAEIGDLSGFGDDSIHFRLLLPPIGMVAPEWPVLAENGSTCWPHGEKALHKPVYTVQHLDRSAGYIDFDVFIHDGGRVTDWVRGLDTGARFALLGPIGGGVLENQKVLLCGDETAFPAIARILDNLPENTSGQVLALSDAADQNPYPFATPPGIALRRLSRGKDELAEVALAEQAKQPDHFFWFASEKAQVLRVRTEYKARQGDPAEAYIQVYWTARDT